MARIRPPRFGTKRRKTRRFASLRWLVVLVAVIGGWLVWEALRPPPSGTRVELSFRACDDAGRGPCALDGDTLAIGKRRIRLTGFDAPEREGACPRESELARQATARLVRWLGERPFEWDGGEEPPRDRYGRELRSAWRVGPDGEVEWLADVMVGAGLASEDGWGDARDWCE